MCKPGYCNYLDLVELKEYVLSRWCSYRLILSRSSDRHICLRDTHLQNVWKPIISQARCHCQHHNVSGYPESKFWKCWVREGAIVGVCFIALPLLLQMFCILAQFLVSENLPFCANAVALNLFCRIKSGYHWSIRWDNYIIILIV